jgi:ABC-type Fe3+-hydroxamate transport system substrate-binding protein
MTLGKITPRRAHSVMLGLAALATSVLIAACGSSSSSSTNTTSTTATSAQPVSTSRRSNARSGPAAGGSIGDVSRVSTSGFGLLTSAGEKVTVKETSSTTYQKGTTSASASAVTKGKTALVLGTTNGTTITATQVVVQPPNSTSKTSSQVVSFKRGAPSTSKTIGQIPANYKQGSGTIVSGTTANKATKAALAAYPGGIVDRVVKLSNGEYEVHNIGVNWPHHIFVNQAYKVVGAN